MADPFNLQTDVVRQHTVPRFLLKHFSTPGKGKRQRLYAFDKAAGRAYATTPDDAGFPALRSGSLAQHFNMLRRLAENWQSGENRFNAPGEKLLGAFRGGELVGVCGLNADAYSLQPRAGRIRHLYIGERYRRQGVGGRPTPDRRRHRGRWPALYQGVGRGRAPEGQD